MILDHRKHLNLQKEKQKKLINYISNGIENSSLSLQP